VVQKLRLIRSFDLKRERPTPTSIRLEQDLHQQVRLFSRQLTETRKPRFRSLNEALVALIRAGLAALDRQGRIDR
jgi:hypothetical protein